MHERASAAAQLFDNSTSPIGGTESDCQSKRRHALLKHRRRRRRRYNRLATSREFVLSHFRRRDAQTPPGSRARIELELVIQSARRTPHAPASSHIMAPKLPPASSSA
jgi:hypothetical protein